MDFNDIVEKDRKNYPKCSYGITSSSECTQNGNSELVCKLINNISRYCPNERSKIIYSKTTSDTKYEPDDHAHGSFGNIENDFFRKSFPDFIDMIPKIESFLFNDDFFSPKKGSFGNRSRSLQRNDKPSNKIPSPTEKSFEVTDSGEWI